MFHEGMAHCPPEAADWHPAKKAGLDIQREVIPFRSDWTRLRAGDQSASVERLSRESLLSVVKPKLNAEATAGIDPDTTETDPDAEQLRDEILFNDVDAEAVSMIERVLYTLGANDVAVLKKTRDEKGNVVEQGTNMWGLGHIVNPGTKLALVIPYAKAREIEQAFMQPIAGGTFDTHDQFTKEKYWDFLKQADLGFTLTKFVADPAAPGGKREITIQFFYEMDKEPEEQKATQ